MADLGHALRRLRADPGTTALAAGLLAVAIGVASAMFTIADHLLIRPVPYAHPSTLVSPYVGTGPHDILPYVSRDVARAWRASRAFSAVSVAVQQPAVVDGVTGRVSRGGMWMSPGTFEMLGVAPAVGRSFAIGEGRPGTDDRVIVSDEVWRKDYAADPQIVGRRVQISGAPATVVGVMPPAFHFPYWRTDLWRPYDLDAPPPAVRNGPTVVYARVAAGVPLSDAAAVATTVLHSVQPGKDDARVILRGVAAGFLDDYTRTAILALAGGVGLVFLVLCANVTNLMLSRMTERRHEFGVCSALGASRARLIWQAVLEVSITAAAAACAGLAFGAALVSFATTALPADVMARTLNPVRLDLRAVAATSAVALLAALIAGLPPAWIGTASNPIDSMRAVGRGASDTRRSRRWTRGLLVGEIALATSLLAGAGVLVVSFANLMAADAGLNLHGVTTAWVSLPGFSFHDRQSRAAFARELERQVRALPGVTDVALSYGAPPEAGSGRTDAIRTDVPGDAERHMTVESFDIGPRFFAVYGIRLIAGREFQAGDGRGTVIVSERLAAALWPGRPALGHDFTFAGDPQSYHVIGVTHEVRAGTFLDPLGDDPEMYTPLTIGSSQVFIGLRCAAACPNEPTIRERIRAASPDAIVASVQPLDVAYREQFDRPRAAAGLASAFAVVSLIAASAGLFSVLSYAVRRRRREFGIRAAMGARPQALRALVLREGVLVGAVGLTAGAAGVWMCSTVLSVLAFGVTVRSPLVWLVTGVTIGGAAVLASWIPAWSAMRSDPLVLLRDE